MMQAIMKRRNQLKKNGKKGFTLVEVIVVLVILAILAAIAIPALTGYIDQANERAVLSDARTAAVALQDYGSTEYGTKGTVAAPADGYDKMIKDLTASNLKGKVTGVTYSGGTLAGFTYATDAYSVAYTEAGGYVATKVAP